MKSRLELSKKRISPNHVVPGKIIIIIIIIIITIIVIIVYLYRGITNIMLNAYNRLMFEIHVE